MTITKTIQTVIFVIFTSFIIPACDLPDELDLEDLNQCEEQVLTLIEENKDLNINEEELFKENDELRLTIDELRKALENQNCTEAIKIALEETYPNLLEATFQASVNKKKVENLTNELAEYKALVNLMDIKTFHQICQIETAPKRLCDLWF